MLGDIGGLWGTLTAIGFVIIGFVAEQLFFSKIIRKIYQIRKYENLEEEH